MGVIDQQSAGPASAKERGRRAAWPAAIAAGCAAATWVAFWRAPVSFDDAFITFRYAHQLAAGHGLVFNVEDGRVEGFSNLLWVLLNALVDRLGGDPLAFSQRLGVLALAASLVPLFDLRKALAPRNLLAAGLLASAVCMPGFVQVAGSGLETSFAGLLIVLLGLALEDARRPLFAMALAGAALVTTRPDGAIFLAAAVVARAWPPPRPLSAGEGLAWLRRTLPPALLALGLLGGLTLFRWLYFGKLVPNTYYAKSADVSSWPAGWEYWLAFVRNSPQIPALLAAWLLGLALRRRATRFDIYAGAGLLAYVLYVARVGGDFMFYRFAFQAAPLVFVALARTIGQWQGAKAWSAAAVLAALALAGARRPEVLEPRYGMQSVARMDSYVEAGRSAGLALKRLLPADTRISAELAGTVPYYSGLFAIDEWGLCDANVASRPSDPIGLNRRGHLKHATPQYLAERAVDLQVGHPTVCDCRTLCDQVELPQLYLPLGDGRCLRTNYLSRRPELRRFVCQSQLPRLYIDCDPQPVPAFRRRPGLSSAPVDPSPAGGTPVPLELLLKSAHGVAFGASPARGALVGQQAVLGFSRALLDSFHAGDGSTGWIDFPLPAGTRRVHLRVGGGADCDRVFAGLAAGDLLLARACGRGDETLRASTLEVPADAAGARLVIVDGASGAWGHILVSDVTLE